MQIAPANDHLPTYENLASPVEQPNTDLKHADPASESNIDVSDLDLTNSDGDSSVSEDSGKF
jgi:hypothetical protein